MGAVYFCFLMDLGRRRCGSFRVLIVTAWSLVAGCQKAIEKYYQSVDIEQKDCFSQSSSMKCIMGSYSVVQMILVLARPGKSTKRILFPSTQV